MIQTALVTTGHGKQVWALLGLALLGPGLDGRAGRATAAEPLVCGVDHAGLGAGAGGGRASTNWSLGRKKVLYIRVRFADQPNEPETRRDAKRKLVAVNRFLRANSCGALSLRTKITRTYVLPKTNAEYTAQGLTPIRNDALEAALADGHDYRKYDLDVVQFAEGPANFSGTATIGGRGCWLKDTSAGIAIHELGHNFGLHHAGSWFTENESVIGPGRQFEYGDLFDTMGLAIGDINHFNAHHKAALGWIASNHIHTVTSNGTYRIFAHDLTKSARQMRALKIPRDGALDYWVEFRQLQTGSRWLMNGAGLRRAAAGIDNASTQLLDATPGSPDDRLDSAIVLGRTFSDEAAGIHITPVAKASTRPPALDVVVNLGAFPANQPPAVSISANTTATGIQSNVTFTATANDPDGDALAYAWDFGDGSFGENRATVSASWFEEGEYVVRCTVTDMKGGTASDSIVVSVGPVTTFRITGRITFNGQGFAGVHVHNGFPGSANRGAYTDSDGTYTIAGLRAGAHTLIAAKYDYAFQPVGFTNPIVVGPNAQNIDYLAVSNSFTISGTVTDFGFGVADVLVSAGQHSTYTDVTGAYAISNVAHGFYVVNATKDGYEFTPTNVLVEMNAADAQQDFKRILYRVSGGVLGTAQAVRVTIGDGVHETTTTNAQYELSIPSGHWNLQAYLDGFTVLPHAFTNPVTPTQPKTTGLDFLAAPGVTHTIRGRITHGDRPLAGFTVSDGTRAAVTDSAGRFAIVGVPDGIYTLTPSAPGGGLFQPPTRDVTLAGDDVGDQDFISIIITN